MWSPSVLLYAPFGAVVVVGVIRFCTVDIVRGLLLSASWLFCRIHSCLLPSPEAVFGRLANSLGCLVLVSFGLFVRLFRLPCPLLGAYPLLGCWFTIGVHRI